MKLLRSVSKGTWALSAGAIILSLGLGEFVARLVLPTEGYLLHQNSLIEYDADLGWRKIPYANSTLETTEYKVHEALNSKGLRGPEYSYSKRNGIRRIMLLGDSFVEGYTVQSDQTVAEQLRGRLFKAGFGAFEVINAGTGGYSTDQELLFFQTEGKKYNPDLIVLFFCYNDIYFNNKGIYDARGVAKPRFELVGNRVELVNSPVPRFVIREMSFSQWLSAKSQLFNAVASTLTTSTVSPSAYPFMRHPNSDMEDAWRLTEALLVRMRDEARDSGGSFLLFYIPDQWAMRPELFQKWLRKRHLDETEWDAGEPVARLMEISHRNQIKFIDGTKSFSAVEAQSGESLYYRIDGHWNPAGHRQAAEVIFEELLRNRAIISSGD